MAKRKRGRNLSDCAIDDIVKIVDGMSGRITWELLLEEIERRLYVRYTRQALYRHDRIRNAVQATRRGAATGKGRAGKSKELLVVLQRLDRIEAENVRLSDENQRLLEQFARWAYNAFTKGISQLELDRPLPSINRRATTSSK